MTSDKCAVHDDIGFDGEWWRCATCGQRFVPEDEDTPSLRAKLEDVGRERNIYCDSLHVAEKRAHVAEDLLREAREALALILGSPVHDNGLYDGTERTVRDVARPALRRIDEALGK